MSSASAFFKDNKGSTASAVVMNRFILAESELLFAICSE